MSTKTGYCLSWLNGRCFDDNCPLIHDAASTQSLYVSKLHPPTQSRKKKPCKFLAAGKCRQGSACAFSHDSPHLNEQVPMVVSTTPLNARKRKNEEEAPPLERRSFRPPNRSLMTNTGDLIRSIVFDDLNLPHANVRLENYKSLASYNWKNSDETAIFVPGRPLQWSPPSIPFEIAKDNKQVLGKNAIQGSSSTFESFFKALLTVHPDFNMSPISLVTDRNSLTKLFDYVRGLKENAWRIDVDFIEDTMFFTHWEESVARPTSYSMEFQKTCTSTDRGVPGSETYHQIVHYKLGGIDCLVRFKADAFDATDEPLDTTTEELVVPKYPGSLLYISPADEIASKIPWHKNIPDARPEVGVQVVHGGDPVLPSTIIKIQTSTQDYDMRKIQKHVPEMWFSQTSHIYLGIHDNNGRTETPIRKIAMKEHFQKWENSWKIHLKALVALILEIKGEVLGAKWKRGVLIWNPRENGKVVRLFEREHGNLVLPGGVRKACWGGGRK